MRSGAGLFRRRLPNCSSRRGRRPLLTHDATNGRPRVARDAPAGYEENIPYTVAVVALEEGPMVTAQLTDVDNNAVEIGMPVEMVTRKMRNDGDERGLIVYGYKFRPQNFVPAK